MDSYKEKVSNVLQNEYVGAAVVLLVIGYVTFAVPELPKWLLKLLGNPWFKLSVLAIIAYLSVRDFPKAFLVAILFLFLIQLANRQVIEMQLKALITNLPQPMTSQMMGPSGNELDMMPSMPEQFPMIDSRNRGCQAPVPIPQDGEWRRDKEMDYMVRMQTPDMDGYYYGEPSYMGSTEYADQTKAQSYPIDGAPIGMDDMSRTQLKYDGSPLLPGYNSKYSVQY